MRNPFLVDGAYSTSIFTMLDGSGFLYHMEPYKGFHITISVLQTNALQHNPSLPLFRKVKCHH